ncbi:hypothetical protein CPB83DRAFT_890142 [Crepidotus variabilis]|uniref:Uncharacterized protein n=1 Tax=Crepidotus variabilis TaxID=179855 RepID=A0A9P6JVQ7_9AGAR|nr:hypothetical protein CPB83DRAFT_890142 [Crepidotus variabilis]
MMKAIEASDKRLNRTKLISARKPSAKDALSNLFKSTSYGPSAQDPYGIKHLPSSSSPVDVNVIRFGMPMSRLLWNQVPPFITPIQRRTVPTLSFTLREQRRWNIDEVGEEEPDALDTSKGIKCPAMCRRVRVKRNSLINPGIWVSQDTSAQYHNWSRRFFCPISFRSSPVGHLSTLERKLKIQILVEYIKIRLTHGLSLEEQRIRHRLRLGAQMQVLKGWSTSSYLNL